MNVRLRAKSVVLLNRSLLEPRLFFFSSSFSSEKTEDLCFHFNPSMQKVEEGQKEKKKNILSSVNRCMNVNETNAYLGEEENIQNFQCWLLIPDYQPLM